MKNIDLGKLENVELRETWKNEASDFTPWLARSENLTLLAKAIGIDGLELEEQEKNVGSGSYRADIVCKDIGDNSIVLIENQLEKTDHNHLGQLLTYSAGLEAATAIWIAKKFNDYHRAALDWLNEITDEKVKFFGLEIELLKIGNSQSAPKFNVVSKPNNWVRTIKQTAAGEITETKKLQLEFWTEFKKHLESNSSIIKSQKPLPQQWTNFSIGRSKFGLVALVNNVKKRIASRLLLSGNQSKEHFHLLHKEKESIEQEFGGPLNWKELPINIESHIEISYPDNDPGDRTQWPKQHQLLCESLEKLHLIFYQRIKELDATDWQPEVDED